MAKKKREPEQRPGLLKRFGNYLDRLADEQDRKEAEQNRLVADVTADAIQQIEQRRSQIAKRITAISTELERHERAGLTDCLLHRCATCTNLSADRDALYDEFTKLG